MISNKCALLPLLVATLADSRLALANNLPTLSPIANITINEDAGNQTVALSGIGPGAGDEIQTLTVTALSSNPSLVSNVTVTYTNPNANGSLTFAPVANGFGTTVITVMVDDGQPSDNIVIRSFLVTVIPVNDPPAISPITNRTISENTSTGPIAFVVADAETPASSLVVAANSSNPALVPSANIALGGSGATRTVTIVPSANQFGTATVTLTAIDGDGAATSESFTVTVNAALRISRTENDVAVSWTSANGVLQQRGEVGFWEDVTPEPTSPHSVSAAGMKFYRLRQR